MSSRFTGVRIVAIFEICKGLLVLAAAAALLDLLHPASQLALEDLVRHFHLNPASHYPRIFLKAAANLNDVRLLTLSFGALLYAGIRFAEAYGLWHRKRWAWIFGLLSGGIYIPFELSELVRHVSVAGLVVIVVNGLIVVMLWRGRPKSV